MNEASTQVIRPRVEIKLTEKQELNFWSNVHKRGPDDCWLWSKSTQHGGHGQLSISKRKVVRAHRVAYILSFGQFDQQLEVCHKCDVPACCNPAHLFLGTHAVNMRDMKNKNRAAKGMRHAKAKLNDSQVKEVRYLHSTGMLQREIAVKYNVARSLISRIVTRKNWTHI